MVKRSARVTRDARKTYAAQLLADGEPYSVVEQRVGICHTTLVHWVRDPAFIARREQIVATRRALLEAESIGNRQNQLEALKRDWERTEQVIAARAADPELQKAPGGTTGIVTRRYRTLPATDPDHPGQVVHEDQLDTALLDARRRTLVQAAQVAGWWDEREQPAVERVIREYIGVNVTIETDTPRSVSLEVSSDGASDR